MHRATVCVETRPVRWLFQVGIRDKLIANLQKLYRHTLPDYSQCLQQIQYLDAGSKPGNHDSPRREIELAPPALQTGAGTFNVCILTFATLLLRVRDLTQAYIHLLLSIPGLYKHISSFKYIDNRSRTKRPFISRRYIKDISVRNPALISRDKRDGILTALNPCAGCQ